MALSKEEQAELDKLNAEIPQEEATLSALKEESNSSDIPEWQSALVGTGQGLTSNFGDELLMGLSKMTGISDPEIIKQYFEQAEMENPVSYGAGLLGGGVAQTMALGPAGVVAKAVPAVKGVLAAKGIAPSLLKATGAGALQGFGTGDSLDERLDMASTGAKFGAGFNAFGQSVRGAMKSMGDLGEKAALGFWGPKLQKQAKEILKKRVVDNLEKQVANTSASIKEVKDEFINLFKQDKLQKEVKEEFVKDMVKNMSIKEMTTFRVPTSMRDIWRVAAGSTIAPGLGTVGMNAPAVASGLSRSSEVVEPSLRNLGINLYDGLSN